MPHPSPALPSPAAGEPYLLALNPQAGGGRAGREWPRLRRALEERGLPCRLLPTGSARATLEALRGTPASQPILAVGGDGTVHGLLPEVCRSGRGLGVVPLGTGNDFAGMLGLRPGDFAAALGRLAGPPTPVDVLWARAADSGGPGREALLLNGLGMGLDAQVAVRVGHTPAGLPGPLRYLLAALGSLRQPRSAELEVWADGQPFYRGPGCLAAVMNGRRYGGGFKIAPHADPADGRLDLVLGGRLGRAELLGLMARLRLGRHLGHPQVRHVRARGVRLRWSEPMFLHLDGEVGGELAGEVQELEAGVRPGALRFLSGRLPG